ncbi:phage GP46 family protein [Ahrensia sp. R2A130]|uniref:phage GP46 family protein n=1 Tax=Ahrensia sp. R2A130 TaxID=744979 RepID=UPI0001E0B502|nr:phage GP46 family protein [Ahrensia sp. R2A130]EFL88272.1 GP46 family protein [Ahrensia sp. R2A130]
MSIQIMALDANDEVIYAPDLILEGAFGEPVVGDFSIAGSDETNNRGGLRSKQQIATAVHILLQTDIAAPRDELRPGEENRGWPGDAYTVGLTDTDGPIGSKLWLLRRRTVDLVETPRLAEDYAREALHTLIDQRVVNRFDIDAEGQPARNRLNLSITGYDTAGRVVFDQQRYAVLWQQTQSDADPLRT